MSETKIKQLKKKANNLPQLPGVYIMKNHSGEIIYVGKAKRLKNRVTQYFGSGSNHTEKVRRMVSQAEDFDYIICDSEFEALTLENSLIKQHSPKYNILLKDDKGYHYINITDKKWRKIKAVKSVGKDGIYIGPYNSGHIVKQTVDEAIKIYRLPDCNRSFDRPSKPCLNFHIGRCSAPCSGRIKIEDYNESVDSAISFIKNGGVALDEVENLKNKMEKAAGDLNFEYAAKLRDRINAIARIHEKQKVISADKTRYDVIASALAGELICVEIFCFKNGHLSDEQHFIFDGVGDRASFYDEFIPQYYSLEEYAPKKIFFDAYPNEVELLSLWFEKRCGNRVALELPKMGDKKRLVGMCASNASEHLAQKIQRSIKETSALNELSDILGLKSPPRYIEAYDISNTAGSENVAGMVVFSDGKPLKSNYRRFKIKSFSGQDDFRSMAEVLERRFEEYKNGGDEAFSKMPDLILLDGGKGQLAAVNEVLSRIGINVAVFGMVKDSKHRTNAIAAATGGNIAIKANRRCYTLITEIQNEVHRFAISYHKARRSGAMLNSVLSEIPGVGQKRAAELIKHFKTIKKIKEASVEELCRVDNINLNTAVKIYDYFSKK